MKTLNVTEKTGSLVGMLDVAAKEDLMITCKSGMTIRMLAGDGISELGRNTQGVKLIRLDDGDEIAAITKLDDSEDEENGENGEVEAWQMLIPMQRQPMAMRLHLMLVKVVPRMLPARVQHQERKKIRITNNK